MARKRRRRSCTLISFLMPAERTTIPTIVSSNFNSVKILQRTGNTVIEYATPMNSMKCMNLMLWLMNSLYITMASPELIPNGKTIPANATVADKLALCLITPASISRPTRTNELEVSLVNGCDRALTERIQRSKKRQIWPNNHSRAHRKQSDLNICM